MHILYVIDSVDRPGGAEQGLATMAPALVARGIRLDVAYLLDRAGFQDDLHRAGAGVHAVVRPNRLATARALRRLVSHLQPDLVHTTLFEADVTGRAAARAAGVPVVSSLVNVPYGREHLDDDRLRRWKVRAAQAADLGTARLVRRFHALSDHVAAAMSDRLRIPAEKIDVVPRGRDPKSFGERSVPRRRAVRAGLGIGPDAPMILAVARHEYQKGLDVAVEAMSVIAVERPDAVLVIAGREGASTSRMRAVAERYRLGDSVRMLGARTDVADLHAAADVFVAPSRWEGLGSATVEAMGARTPIVLSDVAALREAVGSGSCAVLVPPGDRAALARAVLATVADADGATRRADRAHERFVTHFTLDRVVASMAAFYDRALIR